MGVQMVKIPLRIVLAIFAILDEKLTFNEKV